MTKQELVELIRALADDKNPEYLIAPSLLDIFINEAESEAAERALYFDLGGNFNVSVVAGTQDYKINSKIIFIERAKLSLEPTVLVKLTKNELDFNIKSWESSSDTPKYYYQVGGKITLYPTPKVDDTLVLDGFRRHCHEMETPEQWHRDLAYWCLYRIYSLPDVDIYNAQKAEYFLAMFTKAFGHKREAWFDTVWRNTSLNSPMYRHPFA
jgi:hypothetical protein